MISVDFEPVDISDYQPPYLLESPSPIPVIPLTPVSSDPTNLQANPPLFPTPDLPQNIVPGGDDGNTIPFQENTATGGVKAPTDNTSGHPRRNNVGTHKNGPAIIRRLPIDGESYDFSFSTTVINEWEHPVPAVANCGRTTKYHPTQKVQQGYLAECYLLQDSWFDNPTCMAALTSNLVLDSWDTEEYYFNEVSDPRVLEARTTKSKYNKDNPSFDTATWGPFHAQFWQAM